jgi:hypothetical protein
VPNVSIATFGIYIDKDTITKIDIHLPIKPFTQQDGGKRIKYHTFANIF